MSWFAELDICQAIKEGDITPLILVMKDYSESQKNMHIQNPVNGETLVHHLVNYGEHYLTPQTVSIIYLLGYQPLDLDVQNINGDTALHLVVRKKGAFRILIALIRCGADPEIKNDQGKTPSDILLKDRPDGWQEMLHWLNKFRPGLYRAVTAEKPNKEQIERLLRYWCRLTVVKNGDLINLKCVAHCNDHQLDLVYLLEKYENTIELSMALLSGKVCAVQSFADQGSNFNINVNAKDYSYQVQYPDYPDAQQPLLEAVWQTNVIETVDVLMSLNPDTTVMYSCEHNTEQKPLFFHLVGNRAPEKHIILRILKECDINFRDRNGRTILHEAISNDKPPDIVSHILELGVNVAARDRKGQTARDLAVSVNKTTYVNLIDHHVIESVRTCNLPILESLILTSYDHILDIKDEKGQTTTELAKKNSSKQLTEMIGNIAKTKEKLNKLHGLCDKGSLQSVKKLLSGRRRLAAATDKCGRNVLHHAILHSHLDLSFYLATEFPLTLNAKDNLGRTPFHYCHLFLPNERVLKHVEACGADSSIKDYAGFVPSDYSSSNHHMTNQRIKEITECDLDVFVRETELEKTFLEAIRNSDLKTIKRLTDGLRDYGGGIKRFSKMLFDCLDNGQWSIANYLIQNGFETDIWKQYQHCSPDNPLCAMMECNHGMTSFTQRVLEVKAGEVQLLLEKRKNLKTSPVRHIVPPKDVPRDKSVQVLSYKLVV